jgi:hypothetical protein
MMAPSVRRRGSSLSLASAAAASGRSRIKEALAARACDEQVLPRVPAVVDEEGSLLGSRLVLTCERSCGALQTKRGETHGLVGRCGKEEQRTFGIDRTHAETSARRRAAPHGSGPPSYRKKGACWLLAPKTRLPGHARVRGLAGTLTWCLAPVCARKRGKRGRGAPSAELTGSAQHSGSQQKGDSGARAVAPRLVGPVAGAVPRRRASGGSLDGRGVCVCPAAGRRRRAARPSGAAHAARAGRQCRSVPARPESSSAAVWGRCWSTSADCQRPAGQPRTRGGSTCARLPAPRGQWASEAEGRAQARAVRA